MKSLWRRYQRVVYFFLSASLVLGTYIPIFASGSAGATTTNLLEPRSIQMSDSGPSGNASISSGIGSGTSVDYKVTIDNVDAFNSLAINFCDNSPIIGDTCLSSAFPGETSPGNMSVSSAAVGTGALAPTTTCSSGSGNKVGGTGWSISEPNAYTVLLTSGGSNTICAGSVGSPKVQTFTLTGITNPDIAESFYARIYTYSSNTPGTASPSAYASPASPGSYVDYGGIALSTVQVITITAKVEEQLEFCVSGTNQTTPWSPGDCSSPGASSSPAVALGQLVNGNTILTPEQVFTGTDYFQLSTNATNGAVIDMHSSNSCAGLSTNGGTDGCPIKAAGDYSGNSGQTAAYNFNTGTAADAALFGAQLGTSSDGTNSTSGVSGTGTLVDSTTYHDGNSTDYGMDDTSGTGVTGTFGNQIADVTGPCYLLNDSITFAATSALTTPAGIYTNNVDLIATGTF